MSAPSPISAVSGGRAAVLAAAVLLAFVAACAEPRIARAATADQPHVILVVVDTLRADRLGLLGHDLDTDAPLADFASRATLFESAWAPSPWTLPSTATILSGLHPLRHRTISPGSRLPEQAFTLPEQLGLAGWQTLGLTRNHNVTELTGFSQGFDRFSDIEKGTTDPTAAALMIDEALDWVDEGGGPFFLYLQPIDAHGPYFVPEEHRADLLGRPPVEGFGYYDRRMTGILKEGQVGWRDTVSPGYLRSMEEQYDTALRHTLLQVSRLFEELDERGLYDGSLIVLTSDHGEELYDHGGFSHGYSLHREVLHVPLLVKLPGQREALRRADQVALADVTPTILEVLGLPAPEPCDGRSLADLLRPARAEEPAPAARPLVFAQDWEERCVARAVVDGRWKLVRQERDYQGRGELVQLFDRQADPGETIDLAVEHPEVVGRLTDLLEARTAELESGALEPGENVLSQMDEDTLRALGYL